MAFTVTVIMAAVAVSVQQQPAEWVLYLPLFPLTFLMFSGLYMFVLPYVTKRRGERAAVSAE
nr:hypothetical protein [Kibdelosporangium phytohabitans]